MSGTTAPLRAVPYDRYNGTIGAIFSSLWKDFEDGVQYYSAKRTNADYIVTRNKKDFEENDIKAITLNETFNLLK